MTDDGEITGTDLCPGCGAEIVVNPKTGKRFCSAKCWLKKPTQPNSKVVSYPKIEKTEFQGKSSQATKQTFDATSSYTRQSVDLCIAMLQAHAEALKANPKIQPIEIGKLMTEAIFEVRKAKMAFEAK